MSETLNAQSKLVGGFNPSEKYLSNWKSSPGRGVIKKYLKPAPSKYWFTMVETNLPVKHSLNTRH